MTEINLWLDSYDDLYSDFDSRQYGKRRISEDFLQELRTEIKYKATSPEVMVLLLPQEKRNDLTEKTITASLGDFFDARLLFFSNQYRVKSNNGLLLLVTGILMMLLNSWVSYNYTGTWPLVFLKVALEPAGWFLVWIAFDILFYNLAELKKEKTFFRQLSRVKVQFKAS